MRRQRPKSAHSPALIRKVRLRQWKAGVHSSSQYTRRQRPKSAHSPALTRKVRLRQWKAAGNDPKDLSQPHYSQGGLAFKTRETNDPNLSTFAEWERGKGRQGDGGT